MPSLCEKLLKMHIVFQLFNLYFGNVQNLTIGNY